MAFNSADINNVPDVHIAVKSEWEPVKQQEKQCAWHHITKKHFFNPHVTQLTLFIPQMV